MQGSTPHDSFISKDDLKSQLMTYVVANEISRVCAASKNHHSLFKSISLGLQEMMNLPSLAFFSLRQDQFQLYLEFSLNNPVNLNSLDFPLGYMNGQYGDAIFLNKHIIVDPIPEDDPFFKIGTKKYAVFPINSQLYRDAEKSICEQKFCPCQFNPSPKWWAEPLGANYPEQIDEDQKRTLCLKCPDFKCHGLLWIDLSHRPEITSEEVATILNILSHTGIILETFKIQNALEKTNKELARVNLVLEENQNLAYQELKRAQEIQKGLLPHHFPNKFLLDHFAFYASNDQIGGDYYDCFAIDKTHLGIVIADVSGHGVSAGLFMSMFKVLLKTHAAPELEPFSILQKINNSLLIETNSEHFVTTFFGIFNKETRELKYSNAGHVPIFIMANGNISSLNSNGIFVGAIDEMSGGTESVYLSKSSRIFLYTDGLSECLNSKGQQFSIERISSHLLEYSELTCKQFVQTLLEQARDFSCGDKMTDDITLLCVDL